MVYIGDAIAEKIECFSSLDVNTFESEILGGLEYLTSLGKNDEVVFQVGGNKLVDELLNGADAIAYLYHNRMPMKHNSRIIPIGIYGTPQANRLYDESPIRDGTYEVLSLDDINKLDYPLFCFEIDIKIAYANGLNLALWVSRKKPKAVDLNQLLLFEVI